MRQMAVVAVMAWLGLISPAAGQIADVINKLNDYKTIKGSEEVKSYRILFDAYLKMTAPPQPIGPDFDLTTIHPKMAQWDQVRQWAESNPDMAAALLTCKGTKETKGKKILGLPYGEDQVDAKYRDAGLVAAIGVRDRLRNTDFRYFKAVHAIAAFATAECYRLFEAGKWQEAVDLAVAHLYVQRQFCDRRFINEMEFNCWVMVQALSNLRDMFYLYREKIEAARFKTLAREEIPALLMFRRTLELPEGDRILAEALIRSVYDEREQPDPAKFGAEFGPIQSADAPLMLFGAAKRWEEVALVHASLPASLKKLEIVYDDWWRRWQLLSYEPILDLETEYDHTNRVRYAVVVYSLENIDELFGLRDQLIAAINGTAMSAALCAYRTFLNTYPNDQIKLYGQFVRKTISDIDPYNKEYGQFRYRLVDARTALDTPDGRIWLEPGTGLLWARGDDRTDDYAKRHTDQGAEGADIVLWPPVRALSREQGLGP